MSFFLHNHLRFTILYNRDANTDLARIVGFEVEPFSVKHDFEKPWDKASPTLTTCNPGRMISVSHSQPPLEVKEGNEVIFTYDVKFTVSERSWGVRVVEEVVTARLEVEQRHCHAEQQQQQLQQRGEISNTILTVEPPNPP